MQLDACTFAPQALGSPQDLCAVDAQISPSTELQGRRGVSDGTQGPPWTHAGKTCGTLTVHGVQPGPQGL